MIVHDFLFARSVANPAETDSPSGVDPEAVLFRATTAQSFWSVDPERGTFS